MRNKFFTICLSSSIYPSFLLLRYLVCHPLLPFKPFYFGFPCRVLMISILFLICLFLCNVFLHSHIKNFGLKKSEFHNFFTPLNNALKTFQTGVKYFGPSFSYNNTSCEFQSTHNIRKN